MSENLEHHSRQISSRPHNFPHRCNFPVFFKISRRSEEGIINSFENHGKFCIETYGSKSKEEIRLRAEIKQLLKEATLMSQPATFAQAAKLRRIATAKEKDIARIKETQGNVAKLSYDSYAKGLMIVKVLTYIMLILWFWRMPVAAISERLVQPFGKILSWRAGGIVNDNVMVGIIPWLVVSTRVSKIVIRKVLNRTWF